MYTAAYFLKPGRFGDFNVNPMAFRVLPILDGSGGLIGHCWTSEPGGYSDNMVAIFRPKPSSKYYRMKK